MNRLQAFWLDVEPHLFFAMKLDSETCHHTIASLACYHGFCSPNGLEWKIADEFMRQYRAGDEYTQTYCREENYE